MSALDFLFHLLGIQSYDLFVLLQQSPQTTEFATSALCRGQ